MKINSLVLRIHHSPLVSNLDRGKPFIMVLLPLLPIEFSTGEGHFNPKLCEMSFEDVHYSFVDEHNVCSV